LNEAAGGGIFQEMVRAFGLRIALVLVAPLLTGASCAEERRDELVADLKKDGDLFELRKCICPSTDRAKRYERVWPDKVDAVDDCAGENEAAITALRARHGVSRVALRHRWDESTSFGEDLIIFEASGAGVVYQEHRDCVEPRGEDKCTGVQGFVFEESVLYHDVLTVPQKCGEEDRLWRDMSNASITLIHNGQFVSDHSMPTRVVADDLADTCDNGRTSVRSLDFIGDGACDAPLSCTGTNHDGGDC